MYCIGVFDLGCSSLDSWLFFFDFLFKIFYFIFLWTWIFACMCVYALLCMPVTCESQKRASDPLELELQGFMSCHVGADNWTQVLWMSSSARNPEHLSSPSWFFLILPSGFKVDSSALEIFEGDLPFCISSSNFSFRPLNWWGRETDVLYWSFH